jgi:hypothetical protein
MTKVERLAAVFAVAFAVIYAPTMDYNWTLATYHPIQGIWQWGRAAPLAGGSTGGEIMNRLIIAAAIVLATPIMFAAAQPAKEPYAPGLGEFMMATQARHAKLWIAGQAKN